MFLHHVIDDVDVPLTIALARCPGCYHFSANDSDGFGLARIAFSSFELNELNELGWYGNKASDVTITSVTAVGER